jgi:hypothetical protein
MKLERFKHYKISKIKGCKYKVELLDKRGKKVVTLVNTPRFWILFAPATKRWRAGRTCARR